ncbi:ATP-dependent zinc metalloprotease FtsH [Gossypium australe]|uniref:ATP-dependent zinc metalloprotease FtsH n=1 Tax=Gossypium australe TaxID=47621 RepID=A0A5B6X3B6_9ROSI|nr:ATP-dependent zinc metalloprotease FtsH [Gossypium australe]
MDIVSGLPLLPEKIDVVWVIVDRLTKSAHFIPVQALSTRLHLSTAFHPQIDGQSERVIQILEDIPRCCVLEFGGTGAQKSVSERLRANGAEVFRGVSGVAPNTAEYWLEATERIMDDLDFTAEEKLKGIVSLLRDESYQWWLTVRDGATADDITWDFFKVAYQRKYVGSSYIDAQRKVFLNLVQGNKSVSEYEAKFLRLSRYARGIVATEHERCVRFEDGLRDELRMLVAPQREREFVVLVEKAKTAERVKQSVRQNQDRHWNKRSSGSSESARNLQKRARFGGPSQAAEPATTTQWSPQCVRCGKSHSGECWTGNRGCFGCGSMGHRVRDCPWISARIQSEGQGRTQFRREGQQPQRGRGPARGGNGSGRGRGAPGRGAGNSEARQPGLVYAAWR